MNCIDCNNNLNPHAKYDGTKRCRNCSNKNSYIKRLPIINCQNCDCEISTTSFRQKFCKKCTEDSNYRKEINQRHWNKFPEKRTARYNAYNNIKINGVKCNDCNDEAKERHHENYNKPLEIIPLCKGCHNKKTKGD